MKISLKAARVNKGLLIREVAEIMGVTETTISNWELGKTKPTFDKVEELCSLYGISVDNIRI